jgi:hypothetical protein
VLAITRAATGQPMMEFPEASFADSDAGLSNMFEALRVGDVIDSGDAASVSVTAKKSKAKAVHEYEHEASSEDALLEIMACSMLGRYPIDATVRQRSMAGLQSRQAPCHGCFGDY